MFTGEHRNLLVKVPYGAQFIQNQGTFDYVLVFHLSEIGKLYEWHQDLGRQLAELSKENFVDPQAIRSVSTDEEAEQFERELAALEQAEREPPPLTPELAGLKHPPKPVDKLARSISLVSRKSSPAKTPQDASGTPPGATEHASKESEQGQWQLLRPTVK